jgi:hypothetical protein
VPRQYGDYAESTGFAYREIIFGTNYYTQGLFSLQAIYKKWCARRCGDILAMMREIAGDARL